jgi:phytoene dehydrogenase-like protein
VLDKLDKGRAKDALPFTELVTGNAWDLITDRFHTEEMRSALLPWPLHVGVGPHDAGGALWTAVFVAMLTAGMPAPAGGQRPLGHCAHRAR